MPIIYDETTSTGAHLAIWNITETAAVLEQQLQLNKVEQDYLLTLTIKKRRLEWLASRVLLRHLLGTDKNEHIQVQIDPYGKPFLPDLKQEFSLSHSADYAAVIICKEKKVGIDIESIKPRIEKPTIRRLSDTERKFIQPAQNSSKLLLYACCWTIKEAVYKLYGKGGLSLKDDIELQPFNLKKSGTVNVRIMNRDDAMPFYVAHYFEINGYFVAYVVN